MSGDERVAASTARLLRRFRKALRRHGVAAALAVLADPLAVAASRSPELAAEYRRRVTRDDPLAFALLYMRHHLRGKAEGSPVTLSEVHLAWVDAATKWLEPVSEARGPRRAFLAPRSMGKSTWWFLILPAWAAAHGHVKFAAAFADTATQAEGHLDTFRRELETNKLLREDYPSLCEPVRRRGGATVADNRGALQTAAGFTLMARGADSGNLGMKVNDRRPDLIICDDLEPGESNYSSGQAAKRLTTLLDDILPLNVSARVILVGTTTMAGGIADNLREYHDGGHGASEKDLRAEPALRG